MVSRINSSNLSRTQKLYAIESIKTAILSGNDEEQNREVERVLDEFADIHSEDELDGSPKEVVEDDDSALYRSLYSPSSSFDFFDLLYTPGDENLQDIRMNLQNYSPHTSSLSSVTMHGLKSTVDETMRESYYEMSNYFFVSMEGIHVNQYI